LIPESTRRAHRLTRCANGSQRFSRAWAEGPGWRRSAGSARARPSPESACSGSEGYLEEERLLPAPDPLDGLAGTRLIATAAATAIGELRAIKRTKKGTSRGRVFQERKAWQPAAS